MFYLLVAYVLFALQALWNLAERLGPAKPRGLSKSGKCMIFSFVRFTAISR